MSFRASLRTRDARLVECGLLAGVLAVATVGCGSSSGNVVAFGTAPVPPAMQHPRLEGFPIPPGFALLDKKTVIGKNGDVRTAHCEFTGLLSIAELDRFYRKTMPEAGFTLRNERLTHGEYCLEFTGPRESSTVSFKVDRKKTLLVVDLYPTSGAEVAPQPKPKTQP